MRSIIVLFATTLLACEPHADSPAAPSTGNALEWMSCGPTDGAALSIIVSAETLACADPNYPKVSSIDRYELEVYTGSPETGKPIALNGNMGRARSCPAQGDCHDLPDATITFEGPSGEPNAPVGTTAGTVRFTEGGNKVVRAFRAETCIVHQMCG